MKTVLFFIILLIVGCNENSVSPDIPLPDRPITNRTSDETIYTESLRDFMDVVIIPLTSETPQVISGITDFDDLLDYMVENEIDTTSVVALLSSLAESAENLTDEYDKEYVEDLTMGVISNFFYTSGIFPGGGTPTTLPCLTQFLEDSQALSSDLIECVVEDFSGWRGCATVYATGMVLIHAKWAHCIGVTYG